MNGGQDPGLLVMCFPLLAAEDSCGDAEFTATWGHTLAYGHPMPASSQPDRTLHLLLLPLDPYLGWACGFGFADA